LFEASGGVATLTLNRPERKNPLTFESYAELRDLFRALAYDNDIKAVVLTGAGDNFCSGGDVHDIIGPLTKLDMPGLLAFTRMTGDLVKAMRACPQPIIAAVDGVCAGAGAILALASDIRIGTARSKTAFLFTRVGLAGADMGACSLLPRVIGQGRAAELLYTGRSMSGTEAERWGFFNSVQEPEALLDAGALRAIAGRRPDLRARHDQEDAAAGMEYGRGRSHRGGSAGAGHLHGDAGFPSRLSRLRGQAKTTVRGQLMSDKNYLGWPFFEPRHAALEQALDAWAAQHIVQGHGDDVDAACRQLVRQLGEGGWLPRHRRHGAWRRGDASTRAPFA
jgi:enoyl-CoA hydratase/carnithine racemase